MCNCCNILPYDVLIRLSNDKRLPTTTRQELVSTASIDKQLRNLRKQAQKMTRATQAANPGLMAPLAANPTVTVYDCRNTSVLPGIFVSNPGGGTDPTAKRTFDTTNDVANFYQNIFGRNSIDNSGMTLMSSIHYGANYNNAFWNGAQMSYGDGDGKLFVDFTKSDDVICHELTHGVTQHTLQLNYTGDAGGLNESISDVFGVMFRQWRTKNPDSAKDWTIGRDIMGPDALALGYNCLRNMANPGDTAALAKQPSHYSGVTPGMDPHYSSGIPNFAFFKMATAIGGNSWDYAGKIWYKAISNYKSSPNLKMKAFADRTRQISSNDYPTQPNIYQAVDAAWTAVGL